MTPSPSPELIEVTVEQGFDWLSFGLGALVALVGSVVGGIIGGWVVGHIQERRRIRYEIFTRLLPALHTPPMHRPFNRTVDMDEVMRLALALRPDERELANRLDDLYDLRASLHDPPSANFEDMTPNNQARFREIERLQDQFSRCKGELRALLVKRLRWKS